VLSQKIALENCESRVLAVARRFVPNGFSFLAKPASWLSRESANGVKQAGARPRGSAVSLEECGDG
jgi:hypothetical protein